MSDIENHRRLKNIRIHNVSVSNRGFLSNLVYTQFAVWRGEEEVDDSLSPVRTVAEETQIGKRLLWASKLAFLLAELVGEFNQEFAVAVSLMLRQRQDTGNVIVLRRLLLFGEVSDNVAAHRIALDLSI